MEDEYILKNAQQFVKNLLSERFHFEPKDFRENQNFYEFILIDLELAKFKHYPRPKNLILLPIPQSNFESSYSSWGGKNQISTKNSQIVLPSRS